MNFVWKDEVREVSLSRHLLLKVEVYPEPTMGLFDTGAIPNILPHDLVKKLRLRMKPNNRTIKDANRSSEKYFGHLRGSTVNHERFGCTDVFLSVRRDKYDILIRFPTKI